VKSELARIEFEADGVVRGFVGQRAYIEGLATEYGLSSQDVVSLCDVCCQNDNGDIVDGICEDCKREQESESEE